MTKGIIVATNDIVYATKDERVVDSRAPGSWKIAKQLNIKIDITRTGGAAIERIESRPHEMDFTPAFIAMLEAGSSFSDPDSEKVLYNLPTFQSTLSAKVYVDSENVYASVVQGLTGTFSWNFKILILGEKIE